MKRYGFIREESENHRVKILCRVMKVSRSGYYKWRCGGSWRTDPERERISREVSRIFWFHRRRYGSRRISKELKAEGLDVGRFAVRSEMLRQGLKAIQPAGFKPKTTDSGHDKRVSPNLLKGLKDDRRQVIVGDITYIPSIADNWVYLAKFQDRETKKVVGWKMSRSLEAGIVIGALSNAIGSGRISRGAIVHTDRGSQYTDDDYRDLLKAHGLEQSMSAKGNCYENAQAESFFARYKVELLEGGVFADFNEAVSETFSYIDGYYNIHRRHSAIGYLTPAEYELRKLSESRRGPEPAPTNEDSEKITSNETKKGGKRERIVSEIT